METGKKSNENSRGLLFDSALLFITNIIGSLLGFAFHLLVSAFGGQVVYADLGSLLSIGILLSVVSFTTQTYVAARVTNLEKTGKNLKPYLGKSLITFLTLGIGIGFLITLLAPLIRDFLQLHYPGGVYVVALTVPFLLLLSVAKGGFQGMQKFVMLGVFRIVEPAIQIMVGTGLVIAGLGATGGIMGTAAGIFTAGVIGIGVLKPSFKRSDTIFIKTKNQGSRYLFQIGFFITFVTSFTNLDILLVKHYFNHTDSAQYIAASFMSKILFLSAVSIGFALFPKTASQEKDVGGDLLVKSLVYFSIFAVPFVVFCSLFPAWVVNLFYGSKYTETAMFLPKMLLAYSFIGFSFLVFMYRLSKAARFIWAPFAVATICFIALIVTNHNQVSNVPWFMVLSSTLLMVPVLIPFRKRKND